MKTVVVEGLVREDLGKKSARQLRREEKVPAVVYGGDQVIHFSTDVAALRALIYTPEFKQAELHIGDATISAIVKEAQFHPLTDDLLHIDFIQLVPGQAVKMEVPLRTVGLAHGVKAGGRLVQNVRKVKVSATPEAMIDTMELDVTPLELGKALRVRDLAPVEGIEVLNSPNTPLVAVEIPRSMRSAQSRAAKEGQE